MATITLKLNSTALAHLARPVRGHGGFQSLFRHLQRQTSSAGELTLTESDIVRIGRYLESYGEGGFQRRLGPIYAELKRVAFALQSLTSQAA